MPKSKKARLESALEQVVNEKILAAKVLREQASTVLNISLLLNDQNIKVDYARKLEAAAEIIYDVTDYILLSPISEQPIPEKDFLVLLGKWYKVKT